MAELLTVREAAEAGYGARSTLNLWMSKDLVTKRRVGAGVRLDRAELEAVSGRRGAKSRRRLPDARAWLSGRSARHWPLPRWD